MAEIRHSQHSIQSTLVDLVSQLRQPGSIQLPHSSPGFYAAASQSPGPGGLRQGHLSMDPAALALNGAQSQIDPALQHAGGPGILPPMMRGPGQQIVQRPGPFPGGVPRDDGAYSSPGGTMSSSNGAGAAFGNGPASHTQLPPISTIHDGMPPPPPRTAGPGVAPQQGLTANRRIKKARSSAFTSNEESEDEGEGKTGIPASGLVAPWEVLRGLAEAAAERAAKVRTFPQYDSAAHGV